MKAFVTISRFFIVLLMFGSLLSCSSGEVGFDEDKEPLVNVNVAFSGMTIYVEPDTRAADQTRATASEAKLTRIAFKVYDAEGKQVYSEDKNSAIDSDFNHVTMPLHVGTYTFVAVAHKARTTESPVAAITSPTSASLKELYVPSKVYSAAMKVTIEGNTSQSVTMEMGKRVTSSFVLDVTDAYPDDVDTIEVTLNPSKTAAVNPYSLNPSTGYALSDLSYTVKFGRGSYSTTGFTGQKFLVSAFLTKDEQQMDVLVNMKDSKGKILYTRTLSDVQFSRHCNTKAKGTFFTSSVTGSFEFDITDDPERGIPL